MRIALVNTMASFVRGGAEILVDDLTHQLQAHGHEVILYRLPFPSSFGAPLIATAEAASMLSFDEFDHLIAFKFPAYCVKHHSKVLWIFHQFRQVYELWGGKFGLGGNPSDGSMRTMVKTLDEKYIPLSRHIYTNAQEVSNRLKHFNNIDSEVLMPPLKDHHLYFTDNAEDYIFYPSRIDGMKRQHLAVEAMRYVKSAVRLVIAGQAHDSAYFDQLVNTVRSYGLEKRVDLRNRWISDEEKRQLFANALGSIYIPYQEDSCGFVSMEAFYSAKPLISCTDSGGTRELLEDGISGYMVEPDPRAIAHAMDHLYEDKQLAERMGKAGFDDITRRDITWPSTIRKLLT